MYFIFQSWLERKLVIEIVLSTDLILIEKSMEKVKDWGDAKKTFQLQRFVFVTKDK